MKVQIGEKAFCVGWRHIHESGAVIGAKSRKELPYRVLTLCFIRPVVEGLGNFSMGEAFCSVRDIFTKDSGRKISLRKALVAGVFQREERTAFWKAYSAEIGLSQQELVPA